MPAKQNRSIIARRAVQRQNSRAAAKPSGTLQFTQQTLQFIEARVVDDDRTLAALAGLEAHHRSQPFRELLLQSPRVGIELRGGDRRGGLPGAMDVLDEALGLANRQALLGDLAR